MVTVSTAFLALCLVFLMFGGGLAFVLGRMPHTGKLSVTVSTVLGWFTFEFEPTDSAAQAAQEPRDESGAES